MKRKRKNQSRVRTIRLVNYCNTQVINPNEYAMIRTIFMHVSEHGGSGKIHSVQQLAEEAAISQASVSRFIKKLGYASFEEFRYNFAKEFEQLYQDRENLHRAMFPKMDNMYEDIYGRAAANLSSTLQIVDRKQLDRVVRKLDNARCVSICGDDHALSVFFTFQLDLMAREVPTFLFKNEEIQNMNASSLGKGDVLLFLNVCTDFVHPEQFDILKQLRKKKEVDVIGLFQEEDEQFKDLFDEYVLYGIKGSVNDGFYSLCMLSQIMSELLYSL